MCLVGEHVASNERMPRGPGAGLGARAPAAMAFNGGGSVAVVGTGANAGRMCLRPAATRSPVAPVAKRTEADRRREFVEQALVHLDLLYNSAVQMTRNPADAQDLVQDTLVKAYRFFDTFTRGTNCKAWLFKIMKNKFINAFRKRSREPTRVDFEKVKPTLRAEVLPNGAFENARGVEDAFEELVEDDVKQALDQLPFEFRMVTVLSDVVGLSYQEIAEAMDSPVGTVRSRLSRARKLLQKKLYAFARQRGIVKSAQPVDVPASTGRNA